MLHRLFAATLAAIVAAVPASARTLEVTSTVLGEVSIVAPDGEATAFVVLVTDRDGVTDAVRGAADTLAAGGAAVALIDLENLVAKKKAEDKGYCHYAFGTFEDLTRIAERELGMTTWRWPVLFGLGEGGGTVAYLSLAQAPANTTAGAVSVGFSPTFPTDVAFCPGAPQVDGPAVTYAPAKALPAPWTYVATAAPSAEVAPFVAAGGTATAAADPVAAGVAATLALGKGPADSLADLPIVELPAQDPVALAIFISGDGGWRDLDKTIGEQLAREHVAVVGLDALRYFWSTRQPEQVAADLQRIVDHYGAAWGTRKVALLGYSFGADILPLAWPHLPQTTRDDTVLVGLLGLATTATLEVTVSGWLRLTASDAVDIVPALAALPQDRVLCIYGRDEAEGGDAGCVRPELAAATKIETAGGHHFDGDYDKLAEAIRARIVAGAAPR